MQIRNIKSQDQAGELSEVKGSLKLSSSVVTQELLRTGYLMLFEVDFIVALETTPPTSLNPPPPARLHYAPRNTFHGVCVADRVEGACCTPLVSQSCVKTKQQARGSGPIQTLNGFSRSRSSDAEGSVKKRTIPELSKGY